MSDVREKQNKGQREVMQAMVKFEEVGIAYYTDEDPTLKLLTNASNVDLNERMEKTENKFKNPYNDAYIWMKGEHMDAQAMLESLHGVDVTIGAQTETAKRQANNEKELGSLSAGKKTLKSLLKSKNQKEAKVVDLQSTVEIQKKDLDDFKKLIDYMRIYHG